MGSLDLKYNGDDCKSDEVVGNNHDENFAICKQREIDILEHFNRSNNTLRLSLQVCLTLIICYGRIMGKLLNQELILMIWETLINSYFRKIY
jgi:hypothetical protein